MAILIAVSHRWDEKYANAALSERPPEALVVQVAETRTPGRALDLACGLGRNALYLAAQGWQVTAVDYSTVALDILSERAAEGLPVHIVHADLKKTNTRLRQMRGISSLIAAISRDRFSLQSRQE